jgi:hypothetical protein
MYDGSDEAVVHFFSSTDYLRKHYNITKFGTVLTPHVQVGAHYVRVTYDLSEFDDITEGEIGFESYNYSLEKRDVRFFLQFDSDPLYYVTSVSGLVSYSSLDDAKANAEGVVYSGSRLPDVDITSVQTMYVYVVLIKEYTSTYPLLSPKTSYSRLRVTGPGLTETEIVNHFEDTSFEPPKRTSAGVLSVEGTPDFVTNGISLVVSGNETRPLFSS